MKFTPDFGQTFSIQAFIDAGETHRVERPVPEESYRGLLYTIAFTDVSEAVQEALPRRVHPFPKMLILLEF